MAPIRLALLGCGDVAQRDYLPEFHRLAACAELVAVCTAPPKGCVGPSSTIRSRTATQSFSRCSPNTPPTQSSTSHPSPPRRHQPGNPGGRLTTSTAKNQRPTTPALPARWPAWPASRAARPSAPPPSASSPSCSLSASCSQKRPFGPVHSAHGQGLFGVPPWEGYPSDPTPFFAAGACPMLDMGVYPLHAASLRLLGPVRRVTAPGRPCAGKLHRRHRPLHRAARAD
jgi:hypothetical protein